MTWKLQVPDYQDEASRDAYRAGYSDGYHGYDGDPGDWPRQPYHKGYWTGVADAKEAQ